MPNAIDAIRGIRERGGSVTFVNPRRIRAVELGLGDHLAIRPDTDLYLLAALLTEIDRLGGWDDDVLARQGRNVEGLRAFIAPFDADSVAGGDRPRPRGHPARRPGPSPRRPRPSPTWAPAATWAARARSSTGCCRCSTWSPATWADPAAACCGARRPTERFDELPERFFDSPVGPVRHVWGHVPGNLLADYITAPTDPLRALVVIGGNPIMAIPGEERLREAFPHLELVVTMDLYRSATAELSDYVLPVSDWLERADYRSGGVAIVPTAQYSDAVVPAAAERKEEWWILARIEQELGLPSALDDGVRLPPDDLRRDGRHRRHQRRGAAHPAVPHQGAPAPRSRPGSRT